MTLEEYLSFIRDEDVKIELEIDVKDKVTYIFFWLSDFRSGVRYGKTHCLDFAKWTVKNVSFTPIMDDSAQFSIQIKP